MENPIISQKKTEKQYIIIHSNLEWILIGEISPPKNKSLNWIIQNEGNVDIDMPLGKS